MHSLKSLIDAKKRGETVKSHQAYLESIFKVENGNYNAADAEEKHKAIKAEMAGMGSLGDVLRAAMPRS